MTLFKIIFQLIGMLGLTDTEEDKKLYVDIESFEKKCAREDASKIEKMYDKLHSGIYFRLASPFILIYLKRWADAMLNGTIDKEQNYNID